MVGGARGEEALAETWHQDLMMLLMLLMLMMLMMLLLQQPCSSGRQHCHAPRRHRAPATWRRKTLR